MTVSAHARALVRWRDGAAAHIAGLKVKAWVERNPGRRPGNRGRVWARGVARGELGFDVARARAYATALIALEDEHAVFTEWTVSRGKGPDNREPGAFGGCGHCRGSGTEPKGPLSGHCEPPDCYACDGLGDEKPGGWPGKLAREWGTVPCATCGGSRSRLVQDPMTGGLSTTRLWCSDCKGRGHTAKPGADRRAPQGRSLARVGRRLRDMLDGKGDYKHAAKQPAECERSRCVRGRCTYTPRDDMSATYDYVCPDCHGTGHNLRGYLPEVEWPARIRRKVCDSLNAHRSGSWESWTHMLTIEQESLGWPHGTRVVPRGEHRRLSLAGQELGAYGSAAWFGHEPKRYYAHDDAEHAANVQAWHEMTARLPRWRRGELLHAQQRRERAEAVDHALEFVAPESSA